jgi:hypothetical protein
MTTNAPVPVHHTKTSPDAWDGDAAERRLPSSAGIAQFRKLFAWIDNGNPDAKTAHKFPHHQVSSRGAIGAANVKACTSGIGILNGGRGGADIPKQDRRAVHRHLAAHLQDAGEEPPPLASVA